jgi:hypothetical protein
VIDFAKGGGGMSDSIARKFYLDRQQQADRFLLDEF